MIFSTCCRPIPGDPIGGYIEPGHGLIIHIEHCPTLLEYQHNLDRYISLHWEEKVIGNFTIDLNVHMLNQRSSLASLALAIAESNSNIAHINAEEFDSHYFSVKLTITVHNRIHLAKILRKIRNNNSVIKVARQKPKLRKRKK